MPIPNTEVKYERPGVYSWPWTNVSKLRQGPQLWCLSCLSCHSAMEVFLLLWTFRSSLLTQTTDTQLWHTHTRTQTHVQTDTQTHFLYLCVSLSLSSLPLSLSIYPSLLAWKPDVESHWIQHRALISVWIRNVSTTDLYKPECWIKCYFNSLYRLSVRLVLLQVGLWGNISAGK